MAASLERVFDPSTIAGNVSEEIKQAIGYNIHWLLRSVQPGSTDFGESIKKRFKLVEVSVKDKADEPKKAEARVVFEVDVTEGAIILFYSSSEVLLI
jgi:hypothetical protein